MNHFLFADSREFNRADANRDGLMDRPEFARNEAGERRGKQKPRFYLRKSSRCCFFAL
jgi:hypothetical protein